MRKDIPVVVCASDEAFAMHMAVMLRSLVVNASKFIEIFVLDGGIQDETKNKIVKSLAGHEFSVDFIRVNEESIRNLKVSGHIPIQTYYRLLMEYLLPQRIDKVIYLDCDMVVLADIVNLWDIEINDKPLYAVPALTMNIGFPNFAQIGLNPSDNYFNAGFLYINLDFWRKNKIGQNVIDFIENNARIVQYHDQDGLNCVLANQWGIVDSRWNVLTPTCVFPENPIYYRNSKFYQFNQDNIPNVDEAELRKIASDPFIIHYAAGDKPWHYGCELPFTEKYFVYLDGTLWTGWRPTWWGKQSNEYKQCVKIYKSLAAFYFIKLKLLSIRYSITSNLRRFRLIS